MVIIVSLLLATCALAALFDVATGRIPNTVSYGAAVTALGSHALFGPSSFGLALLTMCAVLAALLPVFAIGWLKGGDVKMIVACSGLVSVHFVIPFLLYTMTAGALVSIVVALRYGTLRNSLHAVGAAAHPLTRGVVPTTLPFTTRKIPYGVAIFSGATLTALAMTSVPWLRLL